MLYPFSRSAATIAGLEGSLTQQSLSAVTDNADGSGSVDWTYDVPNSQIDFLARMETAETTSPPSTIKTAALMLKNDVVTITNNDAPVIDSSLRTGAITESADNPGGTDNDPADATGTITFDDVDLSDTPIASITASSVSGGSASLSSDSKKRPYNRLSLCGHR